MYLYIVFVIYRELDCLCGTRTELLRLVAAVSTVVLQVAQQPRVDAVAVGTAELGRHLAGDVH